VLVGTEMLTHLGLECRLQHPLSQLAEPVRANQIDPLLRHPGHQLLGSRPPQVRRRPYLQAIPGDTRLTPTGGGQAGGFFGLADPLLLRAAPRSLRNDLATLRRPSPRAWNVSATSTCWSTMPARRSAGLSKRSRWSRSPRREPAAALIPSRVKYAECGLALDGDAD
jgi:hypothetical protein